MFHPDAKVPVSPWGVGRPLEGPSGLVAPVNIVYTRYSPTGWMRYRRLPLKRPVGGVYRR